MFFKLSAPHVSVREYLYEGNLIIKPLVLLIACLVKLLRLPIPGSTDIPPVASLRAFRIAPEKMDGEILTAITPIDAELQASGFTRIDWVGLSDVQHNTRYGGAAYRSADGDTVAWVRYRLWPNLEKHNKFARLALYSLGPSGEIVLTTAATRDLLEPPEWHVEYHPKCGVVQLQEFHREHVLRVLGNTRVMIAKDAESAFDLLEHTHEEFVEFQVGRGVFVPTKKTPITDTSVAATAAATAAAALNQSATALGPINRSTQVADSPDSDVHVSPIVTAESVAEGIPVAEALDDESLAEMATVDEFDDMQPIIDAVRKQESKRSGRLAKLFILAISIAFFIGLGALQWDMQLVIMLVPILFVHEFGHYIAMKTFGYKNIHMFFIPLLGAAVSGRNYRVSGWKKAIVALAGPIPSIALGLGLGFVAYWYQNATCYHAAIVTLILNVMNLAPFLPLDGGHVAHITVFSRSKILDLLFRVGTIALLLVVAVILKDRFLIGFGVVMVIGIPNVWRTMKATDLLRSQTLPEPSDDAMSPEAIRAVVDAIQKAKMQTHGTDMLAKLTLAVYENVITRPPSWPATIGIWAIYFCGLIAGVAGMIAITIASLGGGLFGMGDLPEFTPHYEQVSLDDGQFRLGQIDAEAESPKLDLLVWRFPNNDAATEVFEQLRDNSTDSVSRLGALVFVSRTSIEPDLGGEPDFDVETDFDIETAFRQRLDRIEQLAAEDERLNVTSEDEWRRAYCNHAGHLPRLLVVCDPQQVDALVSPAQQLPYQIGPYTPIGPWTPKLKLTEEQAELHRLLRILQGVVEQPPWQDELPSPEPAAADFSAEQMEEYMLQAQQRVKQTYEKRLNWIKAQADSSQGTRQKLCTAYLDFETALKEWREDERPADQRGKLPDQVTFLEPLLPELGYLHKEHPLFATSVTVNAYEITDEADEISLGDGFPVSIDGQAIVNLYLNPSQDAAAAFACVHAWIKKQGITSVIWAHEELVPVQSE